METKEMRAQDTNKTAAQRNTTGQTVEIDLVEVFFALLHKWKILLLALIIGAAVLCGFRRFFVKEIYEATTKMYITNTENNILSYQDLQIGSALAEDYKSIIISQPVLDKVIRNLQLDLDYNGLLKLITVANPTGTHIINTSVRTPDKEKSLVIANELLDVSIDQIKNIVSTGEPSVIETSRMDRVQNVTPGLLRYTAIGGLIGFLIAAVCIIIGVVTDDSIRSDDDVEKYLKLPILSAVPDEEI